MTEHPSRIARFLLGSDNRQRIQASQSLLALTVYVVFAFLTYLGVRWSLINTSQAWVLTTWNLVGGAGFYACIRSGLNLKLRTSPSLAVPQSLWAIVGITWSYAITGPARGAVLQLFILIVVFSMFELTPTRARAVAATAFLMLGTAMVWRALYDPARYDPHVEGLHLLSSGIVLAATSVLAVRIGKLRSRLKLQRMELAEALDRIRALATHDDLTGLANRRAAIDRMRDELAVRGRAEPFMCLALMDIDRFKLINDEHGHAAGDAVLHRFAEWAQREVRAGDMLARWGGEEFLLVMPATAASDAVATMQRVRQAMQRESFQDVAPGVVVTFSAGVSECTGRGDMEAAIARADAAMYEAKRAGRDRVVACGTVGSLPRADPR